jgi:hypothetical protein
MGEAISSLPELCDKGLMLIARFLKAFMLLLVLQGLPELFIALAVGWLRLVSVAPEIICMLPLRSHSNLSCHFERVMFRAGHVGVLQKQQREEMMVRDDARRAYLMRYSVGQPSDQRRVVSQ